MSASDTDIEKQKRHHKPSLFGIGTAVTLAVLAALVFFFFGYGAEIDEATSAEPTVETQPLSD